MILNVGGLVIYFFLSFIPFAKSGHVDVFVDSASLRSKTSTNFVCVTLDWWPSTKCDYDKCSWHGSSILSLNLSHPRLNEAVKFLAPFILRVGGSLQDLVVYKTENVPDDKCQPMTKVEWQDNKIGFRGGCLNMSRWDEINSFCEKAGCRIAFGLNGLYGRKQDSFKQWSGDWDPSNAKSLIEYSEQRNFPIHSWQFGNELVGPGGIQCQLSAEQYANDTVKLREIIDEVYDVSNAEKPKLATPDTYFDLKWYKEYFTALPPGVVDIVTFHNYYLGRGDNQNLIQRVLSLEWTQSNQNLLATANNAMRVLAPEAKLWIGESGGAFNSGQHHVTNSFVSGFWYLSSLAQAARSNYDVFCRQTLLGGNYGLLNSSTFEPFPDFYGALFFQRLMGSGVFETNILKAGTLLQVFAHCQRRKQKRRDGDSTADRNSTGLAVLIMNYSTRREVGVKVDLLLGRNSTDSLGSSKREYHFTAENGDLRSQKVLINGLEMDLATVRKPSSFARRRKGLEVVTMAPVSYTFVLYNRAKIAACSGSE